MPDRERPGADPGPAGVERDPVLVLAVRADVRRLLLGAGVHRRGELRLGWRGLVRHGVRARPAVRGGVHVRGLWWILRRKGGRPELEAEAEIPGTCGRQLGLRARRPGVLRGAARQRDVHEQRGAPLVRGQPAEVAQPGDGVHQLRPDWQRHPHDFPVHDDGGLDGRDVLRPGCLRLLGLHYLFLFPHPRDVVLYVERRIGRCRRGERGRRRGPGPEQGRRARRGVRDRGRRARRQGVGEGRAHAVVVRGPGRPQSQQRIGRRRPGLHGRSRR
mmetsp:Transcript_34370/g.103753  ORF Transcript_34370/g.103753 Transcript_34370/m.103753 type:complete len:273 (-) Transcript_34370:989-1807(-)